MGNGSDDLRRPDGLGVRGPDDERRHKERRARDRHERDRRRGDRRRARIRTLLMTAAALAAPHAIKLSGVATARQPMVTTSITSFDPIEASHAYDDLIQEAADTYDLDPAMIRAVMQTESAFDATAVSPVGALGLMQLMPSVAEQFGVTDPMDPRQNIMAGSEYLRRLLDTHKGDVKLALASYNAGPGNVAKYNAIPPFKETRNYVKRITGLLAQAKANNH